MRLPGNGQMAQARISALTCSRSLASAWFWVSAISGKSLNKDEKRAASLLAKEWRAWLGVLADVVEFMGCAFVAHASFNEYVHANPRWNEIVGEPSLSTLTSMGCSLSIERAGPLLVSASLKHPAGTH